MDGKKIGLIALAVVALVVAGFSFKHFFMNETPVAGADEAARQRDSHMKLLQQAPAGRNGNSGGTSTGAPGRPGGPGRPQ